MKREEIVHGGERQPDLGPVDKLIGPEAGSGDVYEAEIAC